MSNSKTVDTSTRFIDKIDVPAYVDAIMTGLRGECRGGLKEHGSSWKANSIFRPEAEKFNWEISYGDGGLLIFFDHKSEQSHTSIEVAKKLGIQWQDFRTDGDGDLKGRYSTTKVEYNDLAAYARKHGTNVEWMNTNGFTEVESFTITKRDGTPVTINKRAMKFYVRRQDGFPQPRYRVFNPGDRSRWLQDHDFRPAWYGLDRAVKMAKDQKKPIVLVNGEVTAAIAQTMYGIPACVVGGGGEGLIPATPLNDLLAELESKHKGDIWICLDCDDQGETYSKAIYLQLQNNRRGIVDLRLRAGADLADWLNMVSYDDMSDERRAEVTQRFWKHKIPMKRASDGEIGQFNADALSAHLKLFAEALKARENSMAGMDALTPFIEKAELLVQRAKGVSLASRVQLGSNTAKETTSYLLDLFNSPDGRNPNAIYTDIPPIDGLIGGVNKGEVATLAAISGSGKSTVMATVVYNNLLAGKKVVVLPTETTPKFFILRLISVITCISPGRIIENKLTHEERAKVIEQSMYIESIIGKQLVFFTGSRPAVLEFKSGIRTAIELFEGETPDLLVVDSMSNVANENDMVQAVGIMDAVKAACEDYNMAGWLTVQADTKKLAARKVGQRFINDFDFSGSQSFNRGSEKTIAIYNPHYWIEKGLEFESDDWNKGYEKNEFGINVTKSRWSGAADTATKIHIHKWARVIDPNDPIRTNDLDF